MATHDESDDDLNLLSPDRRFAHADPGDAVNDDPLASDRLDDDDDAHDLLDDPPESDSNGRSVSSLGDPVDDTTDLDISRVADRERDRGVTSVVTANWVSVVCLLIALGFGAFLFTRINRLAAQVGAIREAKSDPGTSTSPSEIERLYDVVAELNRKVDTLASQSTVETPTSAVASAPTAAETPAAVADPSVVIPADPATDAVAEELRKQQQILDEISKNQQSKLPELNAAMQSDAKPLDSNTNTGASEKKP